MNYKLTKKQYDFLCEIYCFFLSLKPKNINQKSGSYRLPYSEHPSEADEIISKNKECGKCFGWWLAFLYNMKFNQKRIDPENENLIYYYIDGANLFCEKMQEQGGKTYSNLASFMKSCGASTTEYQFGPDEWKLPPHKVIRNMIEKGAL